MAKKQVTKKQPKETTLAPTAIKNVHEALFKFQSENIVIPRKGTGTGRNGTIYRYAMLDDIISITRPVLQKYGLSITQLTSQNKLTTVLWHHETDTNLEATLEMPTQLNPQDTGAMITYYRRYMLTAMLGLSTEDDTDSVLVTGSMTTEEVKTTVKEPSKVEAERSDSFKKATGLIESCQNEVALEAIKGQISRSTRLTDEEKKLLQELVAVKEHEFTGDIQA